MPIVDYVQRDGRVAERELLEASAGERLGASSRLEVPLGPIDEWMDGYGAHVRRSQLVEALYATAVRSSARSRALRQMPFLRPATQLAPTCRRTQLARRRPGS